MESSKKTITVLEAKWDDLKLQYNTDTAKLKEDNADLNEKVVNTDLCVAAAECESCKARESNDTLNKEKGQLQPQLKDLQAQPKDPQAQVKDCKSRNVVIERDLGTLCGEFDIKSGERTNPKRIILLSNVNWRHSVTNLTSNQEN